MSYIENFERLKEEINQIAQSCGRNPKEIQLVVVSKGQSWKDMSALYQNGERNFGENRVQEALAKIEEAPQDCQWHFIGSLQKNKVKKILGAFALIHSVDSLELAKKISDLSREQNLKTKILLQVNISGEQSKQGMSAVQCLQDFNLFNSLPGVSIQGFMTMAPFVEDEKVIRNTFAGLRILKDKIILKYNLIQGLPHLSMGMSHDYKIAIEEGSTLLRIGSFIWKNNL